MFLFCTILFCDVFIFFFIVCLMHSRPFYIHTHVCLSSFFPLLVVVLGGGFLLPLLLLWLLMLLLLLSSSSQNNLHHKQYTAENAIELLLVFTTTSVFYELIWWNQVIIIFCLRIQTMTHSNCHAVSVVLLYQPNKELFLSEKLQIILEIQVYDKTKTIHIESKQLNRWPRAKWRKLKQS